MIPHAEHNYLRILGDCVDNGVKSENRTAVQTFKRFGGFWYCEDVLVDFPLLTTKRIHWSAVVAELLWFLSGSTNVNDLDSTIWNEWADAQGDLGPVYGRQWRRWYESETHFDGPGGYDGWTSTKTIDQIAMAEQLLKTDPDSRRILVSAWNVADLPFMALAPCHYAFQLQHCNGDLHMLVNMRSVDVFLGLPFNIASYGLLLMMFAHAAGLRARRLCFSLGDYHLYENHIAQAILQLDRVPVGVRPRVRISGSHTSILNIDAEDIHLDEYHPHPAIKAEVAV